LSAELEMKNRVFPIIAMPVDPAASPAVVDSGDAREGGAP
jgi:hypothetical protein